MQVLSIILAILAFGVLVIVHEFGHFITAKRGGVQVNEFWIGMGPTILKHEYHGTMYCLKLLPFGGACVMEGEDGESESEHAFGRAPPPPHPHRRSRRADEFSHRLCHPAVRGTGADR